MTGLKASEAALHADLSDARAATAEARAEGDAHKQAGDVARQQVVAVTEQKATAEAACEVAQGKLATAEAAATAQVRFEWFASRFVSPVDSEPRVKKGCGIHREDCS